MSREFKAGIFLISFIFSVLCFSAPAAADKQRNGDPGYLFYKGNTLYEEGRYDDAVGQYSKLLARGSESGNLYYNIGNCYFKKGELGKAILYYERAMRLMPRDSDLKSNYEFVLSQLNHPKIKNSASWSQRISSLFDSLTVNEITVLLSAVFICFIIVLVLRLFFETVRRYSMLIIPVLVIIFLLVSAALYGKVSMHNKEAVILSEVSDARFEPVQRATVHFTLHEGMKIEIIEVDKDWAKIRRTDGKAGWIQTGDMEKI